MKEIEFGHKVKDNNGKTLGVVTRLITDTWSGDLRKFTVRNEKSQEWMIFSSDDIAEVTQSIVKLKKSAKPQ